MKSKKPQKATPASESNICFTIMPFGSWFDSYYEEIYVPAIESAGLVARRADDLYRPSAIVHDIWTLTTTAKILLADLTGKNPNVFYELGLAHAIAKPVILLTESIEDVPFDLRALRVITYDKNVPKWGEVLEEKIKKSIQEVLSSPLEAVLPTFLKIREEKKPTITQSEKDLLSLRQDVELLRREFQMRIEQLRESRPDRISLAEADSRLRRYLSVGLPEDEIVSRMRAFGAPVGFVMDRLQNYQSRRAQNQSEKNTVESQKTEEKAETPKKEEKA